MTETKAEFIFFTTLLIIFSVVFLTLIPRFTHAQEISQTNPSREEVTNQIKGTFGNNWQTALAIAKCESSLRPYAKNRYSSAKGIFQVINGTWNGYRCVGNPYNAIDNINCAKKIFDRRGTQPWISSRLCWRR